MRTLHPYIMFPGNCEEAFTFYKSVFGGDFNFFGRFGDIPSDEENILPEEKLNQVMHVSLPMGKQNFLMGSDSGEQELLPIIPGNSISLAVQTESKEDADRIFNILSKDGKITMQIGDVFWGSYYGSCMDKFGVSWMVSFDKRQQQLKE